MRNEHLQWLCRQYLSKLRTFAYAHGLGKYVEDTLTLNSQNKCEATEEEVQALSRLCDEERVTRKEVCEIVGKSYRKTLEDGDFEKVRRLKHVGTYSRVSALLLGSELKAIMD